METMIALRERRGGGGGGGYGLRSERGKASCEHRPWHRHRETYMSLPNARGRSGATGACERSLVSFVFLAVRVISSLCPKLTHSSSRRKLMSPILFDQRGSQLLFVFSFPGTCATFCLAKAECTFGDRLADGNAGLQWLSHSPLLSLFTLGFDLDLDLNFQFPISISISSLRSPNLAVHILITLHHPHSPL